FTDRFLKPDKKASGEHPFDRACARSKIGHRLIPPRHPQTNGMVERMNGRIQEILQQTRFASAKELETTLKRYLAAYNHHIPQRALEHRTPVQAIEEWMLKKPDGIRFVPVYDQAGLDSFPCPPPTRPLSGANRREYRHRDKAISRPLFSRSAPVPPGPPCPHERALRRARHGAPVPGRLSRRALAGHAPAPSGLP
ncbi:MAG: integrase core domain-containing protein, partial [Candidatus Accumulibacter sp.]|nr:integrase core domain-containing protein [Accumulibacter sp.]